MNEPCKRQAHVPALIHPASSLNRQSFPDLTTVHVKAFGAFLQAIGHDVFDNWHLAMVEGIPSAHVNQDLFPDPFLDSDPEKDKEMRNKHLDRIRVTEKGYRPEKVTCFTDMESSGISASVVSSFDGTEIRIRFSRNHGKERFDISAEGGKISVRRAPPKTIKNSSESLQGNIPGEEYVQDKPLTEEVEFGVRSQLASLFFAANPLIRTSIQGVEGCYVHQFSNPDVQVNISVGNLLFPEPVTAAIIRERLVNRIRGARQAGMYSMDDADPQSVLMVDMSNLSCATLRYRPSSARRNDKFTVILGKEQYRLTPGEDAWIRIVPEGNGQISAGENIALWSLAGGVVKEPMVLKVLNLKTRRGGYMFGQNPNHFFFQFSGS